MPFAIEIASFGNATAPVSCGAVMGCPATERRAPALRRRCSVRGGRSRLCAELQGMRRTFAPVSAPPSAASPVPLRGAAPRPASLRGSAGVLPSLRSVRCRSALSGRGAARRSGGCPARVPPGVPPAAAVWLPRFRLPRRALRLRLCCAPAAFLAVAARRRRRGWGRCAPPRGGSLRGAPRQPGRGWGCLSSLGGALCRAPAGGCAALAVAPPAPAQGRGCAAPCVALRAGAFWGLARVRCGARVTGAAAPSNPCLPAAAVPRRRSAGLAYAQALRPDAARSTLA